MGCWEGGCLCLCLQGWAQVVPANRMPFPLTSQANACSPRHFTVTFPEPKDPRASACSIPRDGARGGAGWILMGWWCWVVTQGVNA